MEEDPCAPYRSTSRRNLPRACFGALWAAHCSTDFWKEVWRTNRAKMASFTHEEMLGSVLSHKPWRCWPPERGASTCQIIGIWLEWTAMTLYTGFLPDRIGGTFLGEEDFIDYIDASRFACPLAHWSLRMLLQRTPEVLPNGSIALARRRALHRGVSLEALQTVVYKHSSNVLLQQRGVFSALRAVSEAPFATELRRHGLDSIDTCARKGFQPHRCSPRRRSLAAVAATGAAAGNGSSALLAAFYRQRDPGLDPELAARLVRAKAGSLERVSGLLAVADRKRNLGEGFRWEVDVAVRELRRWFEQGFSPEHLLPTSGPPNHLVVHFLDKLSLALRVPVVVDPPAPMLPGEHPGPAIAEVDMSVLPDHDIISDHIRRTGTFHCPSTFKQLLLLAAAAAREAAGGHQEDIMRVVEVGGFLGDCILWSAGWLGPSRIRALEVEPVAAATARLRETLVRAGFDGSVTVYTEPLGDGSSMDFAAPRGAGGGAGPGGTSAAPANPNFAVRRGAGGSGGSGGKGAATATLKLRGLDEVLESWPALPPGAHLDLVRIKAAGSEDLIVSGLQAHLAARRVRRLYVESNHRQIQNIMRFMEQWPDYEPDQRRVRSATRTSMVYTLAAKAAGSDGGGGAGAGAGVGAGTA